MLPSLKLVATASLAASLFMVSASESQAALRCSDEDQIVAGAVMIMQITPSLVADPLPESENCRVQGEMVRSFLGPHPVGTVIETMIPCRGGWTDASGQPVVVPGASYVEMGALQAATVIELHISESGGPAAGAAGVVLLDAPTDTPARESACAE